MSIRIKFKVYLYFTLCEIKHDGVEDWKKKEGQVEP